MIEFIKYVVEYLIPRTTYTSKADTAEAVVVPAGSKLEKLPEAPRLTVCRIHSFDDVGSLAAWLLKWAGAADTEVLVNVKRAEVRARLSQDAWSDTVVATFTETAEYKAVQALCGAGVISQEVAYRHLGQIRHVVQDSAKVLSQLARLEIKTKGTFAVGVDPRTGARTAKVIDAGTEYPVDIPTEIVVRTLIHNGSNMQFDAVIDVGMVLSGVTPMLTFSLRNQVQIEEGSIREEVRLNLVEKLGEGWLVGYGALAVSGSRV